jgi:hypothetical protein
MNASESVLVSLIQFVFGLEILAILKSLLQYIEMGICQASIAVKSVAIHPKPSQAP